MSLKKVLEFICVKEIPAKHLVKWWTKDARDILLANHSHYQRDNMDRKPFSYRHLNMYMHTVELVRLSDSGVIAYNWLIALSKSNMAEMQPYAETGDVTEHREQHNHSLFATYESIQCIGLPTNSLTSTAAIFGREIMTEQCEPSQST